jgi:hypothetical protein
MKFRKKPVVIEAIKLTEELFWECYKEGWCGPLPQPFDTLQFSGSFHPANKTISSVCVGISTREGNMRGDIGDWIIRGVKGELYPCKPEIFEATYEPA